jgi:hypothetical protein
MTQIARPPAQIQTKQRRIPLHPDLYAALREAISIELLVTLLTNVGLEHHSHDRRWNR